MTIKSQVKANILTLNWFIFCICKVQGPIPAYDYIGEDLSQYYCFEDNQPKCAKVTLTLSYSGVKAVNI